MNTKDFHHDLSHASGPGKHDLPHRAMSRAPAHHNLVTALLGTLAAAAVLAVLWLLYAFGS